MTIWASLSAQLWTQHSEEIIKKDINPLAKSCLGTVGVQTNTWIIGSAGIVETLPHISYSMLAVHAPALSLR